MYSKAWHVQGSPTASDGAQMHLRCDLDFLGGGCHRDACASSTLSAQNEARIAVSEGVEDVCKLLGDVLKSLAHAGLAHSSGCISGGV